MFTNYKKVNTEEVTMFQRIAGKYIAKLAEKVQNWQEKNSSLLTAKYHESLRLLQVNTSLTSWLAKQSSAWQVSFNILRSDMAVAVVGSPKGSEIDSGRYSDSRYSHTDHQMYFTVYTPTYQKLAQSPRVGTKNTLFYTSYLTNNFSKLLRWVTTPPTSRHTAIVISEEKLIQRYTILGSLLVLRQSIRLQEQRWAGFNARRGGLIAKRLFDTMISAIVLMLLTPLFLLVALLIRLDSSGPIFFSQIRIGKQGKPFTMWKFRSMYADAEERKAALLKHNEMEGGVLFKMKQDPRITSVGRVLRKFSIDELPQFWNVLVGEMSLVGPRPPLPNEVANYTPYQRQRLEVTPGITCIWQVSGRSEIPFPQQVEMDLNYIATQSFFGDLLLLLKTVPAVLKGRGAY